LLAQPVDGGFEGQAGAGQRRIGGLGAQRIGFAVELLGQKIQLAPAGLPPASSACGRFDMGGQPVQLLADIRFDRQHGGFLLQALGIEAGRQQLVKLGLDARLDGLGQASALAGRLGAQAFNLVKMLPSAQPPSPRPQHRALP
jgi:hypothetical protein